jgi:hypothetical protein
MEKPSRCWQMKLDISETAHLGKGVIFLGQLTAGYEGYQPLLTAVQSVQAVLAMNNTKMGSFLKWG